MLKCDIKLYAKSHYSGFSEDMFYQDFKLLSLIKRRSSRVIQGEIVDLRAFLNNIISFVNSFTPQSSTHMIISEMSNEELTIVKPFLVYLKLISPADLPNIRSNRQCINFLQKI